MLPRCPFLDLDSSDCSWICGCGGLAETAGDPFRQAVFSVQLLETLGFTFSFRHYLITVRVGLFHLSLRTTARFRHDALQVGVRLVYETLLVFLRHFG